MVLHKEYGIGYYYCNCRFHPSIWEITGFESAPHAIGRQITTTDLLSIPHATSREREPRNRGGVQLISARTHTFVYYCIRIAHNTRSTGRADVTTGICFVRFEQDNDTINDVHFFVLLAMVWVVNLRPQLTFFDCGMVDSSVLPVFVFVTLVDDLIPNSKEPPEQLRSASLLAAWLRGCSWRVPLS